MNTTVFITIGKVLAIVMTILSLILFVYTLIIERQIKKDTTIDETQREQQLNRIESNKRMCIGCIIAPILLLIMLNMYFG